MFRLCVCMKFSVLIFILPSHVETFVEHKNNFMAKCNITYQKLATINQKYLLLLACP
jgi:hypothetical protein